MMLNNFLGRKTSLTNSLDISLGKFLWTEETIVAKINQKSHLKTKILEFGSIQQVGIILTLGQLSWSIIKLFAITKKMSIESTLETKV